MQTAYPLGLNDNIMGKGNISRTSSIDIMDIVDKRNRNQRSHGKRINRNKRVKQRTNFSLKELLIIFKNNGRHHIYTDIYTESQNISFQSRVYEGARIITAFCYHRLFPRIDKVEDHKRHFLSIKYINRGIDFINLSSIFNDSSVQSLIPPYFDNTEPPIISYSYKKSSRNLIFNYTSTTSDADIENNTPST